LERIVHPAVGDVLQAQVASSTAPVVAIEAIKLLEAGLDRTLCDQVWVTTCSRRQQLARLAASRGMSAQWVRSRLAVQMPFRQMAARADRVIDTGGTIAATRLMVLEAWVDLGSPIPEPLTRTAESDDAEGIAAVLNAVVREGDVSIIDRMFTPAQERAFLRRLPPRARMTVAEVGKVTAGFQVIEPYATYTGAMDHVATMGTYVTAPVRGAGLGHRLSEATFNYARTAGYSKVVIQIRADNPDLQTFYSGLGFRPCGRLARQARVADRYVDVLLFEMFVE
jgi:L-amino acid N-acyltransferase YncA